MSIEQFLADLDWTKTKLAEELGYSNRQALTYIDQKRSGGFILRMAERFPYYLVRWNPVENRHDIVEMPIDFMNRLDSGIVDIVE